MPADRQDAIRDRAFAGIDFMKAAFCPLEFKAVKLGQHPEFRLQAAKDPALADLEIGPPLRYARQFPFTDSHGHRKTGTQITTAPFGCASRDFDLFLGLYTYLKSLKQLPPDGRTHFTIDFLARRFGLPATCQKDYARIRSRLFRFSYLKYTNTACWKSATRTYDIVNFGFFSLDSLSRLTASRRPVSLQWDPAFLRLVAAGAYLAFDQALYQSLSPPLRRLYLIANRDGWNQRDSGVYLTDAFAVHQIGFDEKPERHGYRLHKLRRLFQEAEHLGIVQPCRGWQGYVQTAASGPYRGQTILRWSRGPRLQYKEAKPSASMLDALEDDALYAQVREIGDDDGKPMTPLTFHRLLNQYGAALLQKHILVILAQKEHDPQSFQRSEIAAFVNRLQHDYSEPDWYRELKRAERLAAFDKIEPNQLSLDMYGTFFR